MQKKISMKKVWVSSDAWRGRFVPVNAVAGSADTGSWDDSPCPSNSVTAELNAIKKALKQAGVNYKSTWGASSNLFCIYRYIVVAEQDVELGKEVVQNWLDNNSSEFAYIP
jgi:hypothetical protein